MSTAENTPKHALVGEMAEEAHLLLYNKECRDSSFKGPGV